MRDRPLYRLFASSIEIATKVLTAGVDSLLDSRLGIELRKVGAMTGVDMRLMFVARASAASPLTTLNA
jgi:hypothetical protein